MIRVTALIILLAVAVGAALTQEAPDATDQADIVGLDMHSYRLEWIRYKNLDADGNPKLTAAAGGDFPYRRYNNGYTRIFIEDLDSATISALVAQHEIGYDEGSIDGRCDPNKLDERSEDIICIPGTRGFQRGNIFLALFDPQTHELVALTTTIDNTRWGALKASWQPTPTPSPRRPDSCGPYAAWEWIRADEFAPVPGVPIVGEGEVLTIYQCVARSDVLPYFQAHFDSKKVSAEASAGQGSGGSNGGSGGNGGGGNGGGGSPGLPNPGDNDDDDDDDDFSLN